MAWNSLKVRVFCISMAISLLVLIALTAFFYVDRQQYFQEIQEGIVFGSVMDVLDYPADFLSDKNHLSSDLMSDEDHQLFFDGVDVWYSSYDVFKSLPDANFLEESKLGLLEQVQDYGVTRLAVRRVDAQKEHSKSLLISLFMDDGRVLNIRSYAVDDEPLWTSGALLLTVLILLSMVAINVWVATVITNPLKHFSQAAERFGKALDSPELSESGVQEVADANRAFNRMQQQITHLVQGRTDMLAAISHDIRTPITRLRLRAEMMADEQLRGKMEQDLSEITAMLDASLSFLRNDALNEALVNTDFSAWLQAYCDDRIELGDDIVIKPLPDIQYRMRPLAMKRAIGNVIDNALRYGEQAVVDLEVNADKLVLRVSDNGPGIADEQLEKVLKPFVRLESSRNRDHGGVGLGLAIVKSIVQLHSGEIVLNNSDTGLEVSIILPLA